MKNILQVREFDTIICNPTYKNEYSFLSENDFNNLEDFILENTSVVSESDALDFLKIGYKKRVGKTISVNSYVGLIQMKNGFQLEILPKIDLSNDEDADVTKKIFMNMLKSMKDFPGKAFNAANLQVSKMNLYELFINMYIQEVRKLIKQGLKSSYISQNDNLRFYKGKLDVSNHIKANIVHKERFYMIFDDYLLNRAENRIVKATLDKLLRISNSAENQKEIRQQLISFEMVDSSKNYEKDFSLIHIDRTTENYRILIEWSKIFLYNKSFTSFSGETISRAMLFPMEKVYESYVAKYMKKVFGAEGWKVSSQDKGYYLFDSPRKFALRPDIVISKDNQVIVLDTKWKRLNPDKTNNYGINQSDMYQMYAYSNKYSKKNNFKPSKVYLLYPQTKDMNNSMDIEFTSDDGVDVKVFFVDVANIETSLTDLLNIV
jgi:McrBC 5-methylcytosine restriction system component